MFRKVYSRLPVYSKKYRYYGSKTNEPINFFDKDVAFESEYYYRQDRDLLKILRQKTEDEVEALRKEIRTMQRKIEEYNRDISETLRFLKTLDNDLVEDNKKKS